MKKALLVLVLLLPGCTSLVSFTHKDHIACGKRGEAYDIRPNLYLHLGNAPQVCAGRDGLAVITIFVNLYNLPAQEVRFLLNDKVRVNMIGKDLTLTLNKVRIGEHSVTVSTDGVLDASLAFSVWNCGL